MSNFQEEKLREACCLGDTDEVIALLCQNINVNAKNSVNGWTPLHWACKRGNEEIVRILLNQGADKHIKNANGETPASLCSSAHIRSLLGIPAVVGGAPHCTQEDAGIGFAPNYLKNPPLNGQVDLGRIRPKHPDFSNMPTTSLPASQHEDEVNLILKVKVQGSADPDFIEVEVPRLKLTYNNLLTICCKELEVVPFQVERIRKLPNTRLRKDSDVKRLANYEALELVIKGKNVERMHNCYQSMSSANQTILY